MNRRTDIAKALRINWVLSRRPEKGLSFSSRALYDLGVPLADALRILTSHNRRDPHRFKFPSLPERSWPLRSDE